MPIPGLLELAILAVPVVILVVIVKLVERMRKPSVSQERRTAEDQRTGWR